ncbi:fungal chitosanase of glycosyl hydrolase group 75-domain-containing protein [Mycena rebaudengoi]|nr:fungal chitosanase of glycosyl hydrolase group 75-domain-containing protein [Mycena rebaudengoi]
MHVSLALAVTANIYGALAAPTYLDARALSFDPRAKPFSNTHSSAHVAFAADPAIDVARIYSAAKAAKKVKLASYPTSFEKDHSAPIYGDWMHLKGVSAFHFLADMDIDCDGAFSKCPGHTTSQSLTSFGALDASKVPYFVLPQEFADKQKGALKPNALGAIICNGKMFYAIFGDTNGATPQVIGEGSYVLGQACFPGDGISGNSGHEELDVAYIVFGKEVPKGVGKNTIDLAALKTLGDKQARLLAQELH